MRILSNIILSIALFGFLVHSSKSNAVSNDHEKAIQAVKNGEILPLDQILMSLKNAYEKEQKILISSQPTVALLLKIKAYN